MNRFLKLACLFGLLGAQASAQSLNINSSGIRFESAPAAPGQPSVSVRLGESGLSISSTPVQTRRVQPTQTNRTLRCNGGNLNLRGSGQRLTILGNCAAVNITGSRNVLSVERVGQISIQGSSNRVTWKAALSGAKPLLRVSGTGNTVLSAARPVAAPTQPKPALKPVQKPSKTATRL
ncbi:DUF3060 domain-containing protein (plasmid) [Deinococcus psychrotolerans]|uniref:DUF3060 domain-containing protein n=1 Tax=Deinococcus psychrotolerans TaxID=2489213 RepID=A0A3G8YJ34_9DEIO|nr:DUF3060 domain-containing protein [Deinococcus psychrotolerans]AZI44760.1 DUF3060 domain-containing protein [Deinococcus psychrotolerans]